MADNRFARTTFAKLISEDALEIGDGYRAKNAELGDAVITTKGNSTGRTTYVTPSMPPFVYSPHLSYWRSLDRSRVEGGFLRYWSKGPEFAEQLAGMKASTDMAPYLSLIDQKRLAITLPPIGEQRAIAHILGTLDDKIELNRRMSETPEAMARALFKSWFVDFDPVRAKAEGRDPGLPKPLADLFPARLVDSELGEIPEGWEVGDFGHVVELLRQQVNPLGAPETRFRHFSIPAFDDGQWPKDEMGESIKSQKSRVLPGVVLLSKLNPEIERTWLVDIEAGDQAICSTEFLVLRPQRPFGRGLIYCLARSREMRRRVEGLVTGTSKSHQRAHASSILALPVVLPGREIGQAFERQADPLLARSLRCRRESRTLASLRDTLLPKLVSGELRIKDAACFIKDIPYE
ncbi:MAG: restriction endonuclease subunit S [Pseudomonadales bacterium]|jgi:type I restriction enzyme S subunit|nr:restriction endonuclease subunit S [Pseudomonadales bacterium]